jgi:hypothetical protein
MDKKQKNTNEKKTTPADRNTAEAEVAERSKPYDEIGETDEEIRRENQGDLTHTRTI